MIKEFIKYTLLTSIIFISCTKKSTTQDAALGGTLTVNINGQEYIQNVSLNIAGTGFGSSFECTGKAGFIQAFANDIENSKIYLNLNLFHLENDANFKSSSTGTYRLVDDRLYGIGTSNCSKNLDLLLLFLDKSQSNQSCSLATGATHTIQSITPVESTATSIVYKIAGSFTCTVVNNAGSKIPITGNYVTKIMTLK